MQALINEEFGDGIMSAIDFYVTIDKASLPACLPACLPARLSPGVAGYTATLYCTVRNI